MSEDRTREVPGKVPVLLVIALANFTMTFTASSISVALPTIGREMAMDAILLSWVASIYILSSAVFMVPMGRLADIHGRKRVFFVGICIFSAASLGVALSQTAPLLLAMRVAQGFGGAMVVSTGTAVISAIFPVAERGKVLGISVTAVYLGLTMGPFLGGQLTTYLGWRSIFFLNVAFGLVIMVAMLWKLKGDWISARREQFDWRGAVIYGLGLVTLIYGFSLLPRPVGIGAVVGGLAMLALFVRYELTVAHPVLDVKLFRHNRAFAFSSLAGLVNYAATFAVAYAMSLYLQFIKGFNPAEAGLVILVMPAVQTVFSPLTGRLSDRIEPRVLSSAGMALSAAGLLALVFFSAETSLGLVIGAQAVLGLGFALFSSPNTNAVMSSVDARDYGLASAVISTVRSVGMSFSLGIVTLLLAVFVGSVQITPANHAPLLLSLKTTFIVFTVLCSGGIFASLARGKTHRPAHR